MSEKSQKNGALRHDAGIRALKEIFTQKHSMLFLDAFVLWNEHISKPVYFLIQNLILFSGFFLGKRTSQPL